MAMMELLGWVLEYDSDYMDILMLDDVSKSLQDKFLEDMDLGLE
jgi:hypothetical protein